MGLRDGFRESRRTAEGLGPGPQRCAVLSIIGEADEVRRLAYFESLRSAATDKQASQSVWVLAFTKPSRN